MSWFGFGEHRAHVPDVGNVPAANVLVKGRNIPPISVTLSTAQLPMSLLKAESSNIEFIDVTPEVSHAPMSWLNADAPSNMPSIVVTPEVSHAHRMSSLKDAVSELLYDRPRTKQIRHVRHPRCVPRRNMTMRRLGGAASERRNGCSNVMLSSATRGLAVGANVGRSVGAGVVMMTSSSVRDSRLRRCGVDGHGGTIRLQIRHEAPVADSGRERVRRLFQQICTNRRGVVGADDVSAMPVYETPTPEPSSRRRRSRRLNIDHLVKGPARAVQNRLRERLHAFVGIKFSRDDAFERHRRGCLTRV